MGGMGGSQVQLGRRKEASEPSSLSSSKDTLLDLSRIHLQIKIKLFSTPTSESAT